VGGGRNSSRRTVGGVVRGVVVSVRRGVRIFVANVIGVEIFIFVIQVSILIVVRRVIAAW
jgi:hypothetical protein